MLERAQAAGTSGLVRKPFSEHGLLSAVRSRFAQIESDDYSLRCLIETMVRDGADETTIVRALRRTSGSVEQGFSLGAALRRLGRFVTGGGKRAV